MREAALKEYVATGSEAAFAEMVREHAELVYSVARQRCRDAHLAEDVCQGVFLTLAQKAGSLRPDTILPAWLYRVTCYAANNAMKRAARRQRHEQTAAAMRDASLQPETQNDQELREMLDRVLAKLGRTDQDALVLHYLKGNTVEQTAEAMGITFEAAKKRIARALGHLRAQMMANGAGALAADGLLGQAVLLPLPQGTMDAILQAVKPGSMGGETAGAAIARDVLRHMWLTSIGAVSAVVLILLGVATVGLLVVGPRSDVPLAPVAPSARAVVAAPVPAPPAGLVPISSAGGQTRILMDPATPGVTMAVAVSPDGRWAASAVMGRPNGISVWDLRTGQFVGRLSPERPRSDPSLAMAFSHEGRLLVHADGAAAVIHDVTTLQVVGELRGPNSVIYAVAFSPDGRLVATGSSDKMVHVWEVASGREILQLQGHGDWVISVCFSPDGRKILSGSMDKTLRLWDVASGRELLRLQGHTAPVWQASFSPDGRYAISVPRGMIRAKGESLGTDRYLRLWDLSSGAQVRAFDDISASAAGFSADGARIISIGREVIVWDRQSGVQLGTTAFGAPGKVNPGVWAAVSEDGRAGVCGVMSPSGVVVWNAQGGP